MKLNIDPDVFNPIYLKHQIGNQNSTQIYFGGSSSGKSYSLAQRVVFDVLMGRNYLIVRQTAGSIKRSCFNEITKAINGLEMRDYFDVNKSDFVITCNINNKQILFSGLDDTEKIKSITPIDGVLTDVWVEEATEAEYKAVKQLEKRLRGHTKFKKRMTLSFNPVDKNHWIYKEYFIIWEDNKQYVERDDVSILKTTYKDNKFLTDDDIYRLENEKDEWYFNVYTLGNWGTLGDVIFRNWRVEDLSEVKKTFDKIRHGLDFGVQDPNALVDVYLDKNNKKLYIFGEECASDLSQEELFDLIKPHVGNRIVYCDSSGLLTIKYLKSRQIRAVSVKKGAGSIEAGITFLKGYDIIVDVNCVNIRNELTKYKWKEDKNGDSLPIPVDRDNHLIDALRYAIEDEIGGGTPTIKIFDKKKLGIK